jgi:ribonuclease P protein component
MRRSLTRRERLGRGPDLDRLFSTGRQVSCRGFKLVAAANGRAWSRVAVVNARGYRRAVDRNRDRRVVRESYRLYKQSLLPGFDLALVLYPGEYPPTQRRQQLRSLLERSGMYQRSRGR